MVSARDVVADYFLVKGDEDRSAALEIADSILHSLRKHWTSDETRLRVVDGMAESSATKAEWWANVIDALLGEQP